MLYLAAIYSKIINFSSGNLQFPGPLQVSTNTTSPQIARWIWHKRRMRPQFYTLLLLAICVTVLAFEPGDLTPLYTFTPAPKPGSCSAEQISALRQHYQEAVGVRRGSSPQGAVQGAVDALDNLKKPIPKKLLHPKQRKTWKRQAQLMQSMFEISADPHSGVGEKNPEFNKLHGL